MSYVIAEHYYEDDSVSQWMRVDECFKLDNAIARSKSFADGVYAIIPIDKWHAGDHLPLLLTIDGIVYEPTN